VPLKIITEMKKPGMKIHQCQKNDATTLTINPITETYVRSAVAHKYPAP
jgi:hypothetical protein